MLLTSSEHEITNILPIDNICFMATTQRDAPSPQINPVITVWTSQAWLILYEYLEKLGSRVLYYDTHVFT